MGPCVEESSSASKVGAAHFGERFLCKPIGDFTSVLPPWGFEGFHVKHEAYLTQIGLVP